MADVTFASEIQHATDVDAGNKSESQRLAVRFAKRRRLSREEDESRQRDVVRTLTQKVYGLFGSQSATDLDGLHHFAVECFTRLSSSDRCEAFTLLGFLTCASSGTLSPDPQAQLSASPVCCSICDAEIPKRSRDAFWRIEESQVVFKIIEGLLKTSEFHDSGSARICAMVMARRLLLHTDVAERLGLAESALGQWVILARTPGLLLSSLRLASERRTLSAFLADDIEHDVLAGNRLTALEFLKTMSDNNKLKYSETCVLAWGQLARVSSEAELNIVLLRLIEYLGHPNPLIHGVAFHEISKLAQLQGVTPQALLSPYWRSIGVTVVKDLQTRPQIAQLLTDLLGVTVPDFLKLTQSYTLPYLVLFRKAELIERIAQARGSDSTVQVTLMASANMSSILALLLTQQSVDIEATTMTLLRHACPQFESVDVADLARSEPIATAFQLLQAAGEEDVGQNARTHQALHLLATLVSRKSGQARSSAKRGGSIGPFFEAHVLGIMALFSDVVHDTRKRHMTTEKRRCLRGMEEMIRFGKRHISNALPQICACLQSALDADELRNLALICWSTMMMTLEAEDIAPLLDSTLAIVVRKWEALDSDAQQRAFSMIEYLFKRHPGLIRDNVDSIPSLQTIPLMAKFAAEINKFKAQMTIRQQYQSYARRCQHENVTVVKQALAELVDCLHESQEYLHESAVSEQADPALSQLVRSVLDVCIKFTDTDTQIARWCGEALGLIGCLDPNRVEAFREIRDIVVVSNFERADETIEWAMFFLREILVKAFLSATNTSAQSFLAYAMQELLKFCEMDTSVTFRARDTQTNANYRRWIALPELVRNTLTPFFTSMYLVTADIAKPAASYPIFSPALSHGTWLRTFLVDLLQKGTGDNARMLFSVCSRVIRAQDIAIANFLLPYVALNVVVGDSEQYAEEVGRELLVVLKNQVVVDYSVEMEHLKLCSENVFQVLDYLSRWMQERKKEAGARTAASKTADRSRPDEVVTIEGCQIRRVENLLSLIPADVISRRAVDCRSYARALFHWEQYIRQERASPTKPDLEPLFTRLQSIYTQIDEPDGIEGISTHLQVLNIDQQILEHRKAGRWTAAQSWYEIQLAERPADVDVQVNLLTCLRESGQHDILLKQVDGMLQSCSLAPKLLPFAAEASWVTGTWNVLEKYLDTEGMPPVGDFNVMLGRAFLALRKGEADSFNDIIHQLQGDLAKGLSRPATASLSACHDDMLKFHVLCEMDVLSGVAKDHFLDRQYTMSTMDTRLELLGAGLSEKQYILGVRRAMMQLSSFQFRDDELASVWLTDARLSRKGNLIRQSFNAVLHASQLGAESATIEHSRLLWKEGQHRKAIQSLTGAIKANAFRSYNHAAPSEATASTTGDQAQQQNLLTARANLLLAKWLDSAGQTQSSAITSKYQQAAKAHLRWEKGHYYLGRHYHKLFESEKSRPPNKQAQVFITGETSKLVIQSYLRSLTYGAKYTFQTLPRVLTLWLDLGSEVQTPIDPKAGNTREFREAIASARRGQLEHVHTSLRKYIEVLPAYVFYTALSQIVARICHPNKEVLALLQDIIVKVVSTHPQQALWTLLAVVKSSSKERGARGATCLSRLKSDQKRSRGAGGSFELKTLINLGQKMSAQLLDVCDTEIQGKPTMVSLSRDLGYQHKTGPCALVVPVEATLTASLPTIPDTVKSHKAFARDTVTISAFLDDVLVLNSLQRPRKVSVRGSDGKVYGLLCKPKDDLRKDQRLMEFNAMINRSLKREAESSKRRLYIKTYAVTPLNEECGLIEWVDKLRTLRDILLHIYRSKGIAPNYPLIRTMLDEANSDPSKLSLFTSKILPNFPPVFHEWFVDMFPEPGSWFTARLKYTRSCAVMSMVGMVLGLGDRHGENILFEETNGGTFHVDFNCLFDKGLTFEKPELVPFRLTHNMVDAFGVYGYEGPFRKSCELTLQILRQNEDTLMTILETFVYDPTTDFIGKKKKNTVNVPDTPQEVLDSVRSKVRGLLKGESVPLSVEGHVDELILQAVSPKLLTGMYIGWCAFF